MSSTQPRKQPNNPQPLNSEEAPNATVTPVTPPIAVKEQFKYGDVKVTSPGVGTVSIVIH
jgi:hypothetical protein